MKFLLPVVILSMAGSLFAMDEYLPIKEKTLQAMVGYGYFPVTGYYIYNGEKVDIPSEFIPDVSKIPIQIKYGIIPGMDVELLVPINMLNEEYGGASGLDRPCIGLKYVPKDGAGGYIDIALPMGAEDIIGENPAMALKIGCISGLTKEHFNFLATIDYTFEFEGEDKYKKANIFEILVKPECKPMEQLGVYAIVDFALTGESSFDGKGEGDAGHELYLQPGVNNTFNETVAVEAGVPFSLLGKNTYADWGIFANLYFNIGL